ncbi:MAG: imidazole glycerol phosphate synthase subunit HisH [Verrucomicrobia bacterium]|nr:imidazole glycerol phosphate synthase subunit HisH [Verrucomicrobiota bacterium]
MRAGVIDYGRGNLRSVERALEKAGATVSRVEEPEGLEEAEVVVLPGVGSFGDAVEGLKRRKLWDPLRDWVRTDRPFLGICLGFQLLWEEGEEAKGVKGLGVLPGRVSKFSGKDLKIPLIGWSEVSRRIVRNRFLRVGIDISTMCTRIVPTPLLRIGWFVRRSTVVGFRVGFGRGELRGFSFILKKVRIQAFPCFSGP